MNTPPERGQVVAALCRWLEGCDEVPPHAEIAARAGWSESTTRRVFKAVTGLTPRAYADAARAERLRSALDDGASVTQAIYRAGYSSPSRAHRASREWVGMPPSSYRRGGVHQTIRFAAGQSQLGAVVAGATDLGVCAILLGDDPEPLIHDLERRFPDASLVGGDPQFERLFAHVVALVEAPADPVQLPLDIRGTAFQRRVWAALRKVPPGRTTTYAELARAIGAPTAARAVAGACAANPLAVAIPCHRVVRSDGSLSGYRWGVDRKRTLLQHEATRA